MKKILSLLSLAVLTIGLLGSCSKINERLDNLEKDVNGLKNEKIASIESQIAGITSSIADLGTIRSDISSLKQSAENHGIDIINLEEADRALADRIFNLEDYLDDVLPNYAEKEWVEATFSTLEQYDSTCTAIAEINVRIGELDARTARDIQACADSMKTWVNEQLDAYYTAAQMDAKLAQMKSAIDSSKASGKITDAKADSIARELAKTKTAVDSAKANIRKEYKAAIKSAIDSSEARLTKKIQNKIDKVNKNVEELAGRVSVLDAAVAALTVRVEALEEMIQSVVIVPAYSDGSVKVENDSLYIDCIVSPSSVVEELDTVGVSILINKVKTKAYSGVDTIKISEGDLFEKDDTKGTVSVRVSVAGKIPAITDSTITVAVNVKKDKSDYTTEFVPVYVAGPALPEGALVGEFSVSATNKVRFSKGNLWYDGSAFKFETNQYDFQSSWSTSHVSHFFWSKDASVAYANTYSDGSAADSDVFFTNATTETAKSDFTVNGVTGKYRTLSKDEWTYLINTRTVNGGTKEGKSYQRATINSDATSVYGLILYPDNYTSQTDATSYTSTEWTTMEENGCVFLPAAGYRNTSSVFSVGSEGCYWSSTAQNGTGAYYVDFTSSIVRPTNGNRKYGYRVRLITEVK